MAQIPISISKDRDMNFGAIVFLGSGTVVLSASGSRSTGRDNAALH
jgi:hypothetical protein